ncbi:MAG: peptide-methionine (S)-S-oxide reductase MsrA [Planctomycetota bacterium]|nr:peptide-methionine (S)-S-oxide reductase MsrA [Planctomycetota bacterium]
MKLLPLTALALLACAPRPAPGDGDLQPVSTTQQGGSSSQDTTSGTTPDPSPAMSSDQDPEEATASESTPASEEVITLGAGCFWCTEAVYERLEGVLDAVSGYMGGHVENPTYREICGKKTGHIEVTEVRFDPRVISAGEILEWFWRMHDPTSWDRQGADAGPQYRSAVFFHSEAQKEEAERQIAAINASDTFSSPIVTEVRPAERFWPAEDYHQDYYSLNGEQGYCRMVIRPKLQKLDLGN